MLNLDQSAVRMTQKIRGLVTGCGMGAGFALVPRKPPFALRTARNCGKSAKALVATISQKKVSVLDHYIFPARA